MSDFKKTLHLPKTSFPMKANLKQKEPQTLKFWEQIKAYEAMISAERTKGTYVLHDGPPYANGNIHLGTALNKVLKDIIVKSRNMMGYKAEYVPGWDCHGLPIEHKVELELKEKGKTGLPAPVIRKRCRQYAEKYLAIQRKEFIRLGVFGVWEEPYLTMNPKYEAATARELGNFMAAGSVMRSKKPIHWCNSCQTALAEAEVEYFDHSSPSIFVRFPLNDRKVAELAPGIDPEKTYIVIWTTTPWTIPDNMAVAVHPDFEYSLVKHGGDFYILASELRQSCYKIFGWDEGECETLASFSGGDLEGLKARHPFYDRESPVVLADYVTLEAGSGCVHTAPGHGREDYETGLKYGLEILSPLSDQGRFLDSVPYFAGLEVFEANPRVIEKIEEKGRLLAQAKISHSYPHCWRCKRPVIFRATTQWFISMRANDLRDKALEAIDKDVEWIPAWGRERIHNMVEHRPDWCISRQRNWGVPIVALLCEGCGRDWRDPEWVRSIVDKFEAYKTGCDYWFDTPLEEIVPPGLVCPDCGGKTWKRESDILDVWFDSGTSFAAVLEQRQECRFPADMYLEGSDQHRGWFHSSLLASIGVRGTAPYRAVLTHGYVVDGEGKKMSKSVGNVVAPQEIIDKYGAEILRMWVSSVDYREDIRISEEILSRLVDAYRRIRNTCRYLLGNLNDFAPADALEPDKMLPLDRYAVDIAARAHDRIIQAYEKYEFHKVFHTLHNLCVTDLSAFYLDIIKDRLYVSGQNSLERRSAQTALWRILTLLIQDMAPVLCFTAEEVFSHLPEPLKPGAKTVFGLTEAKRPQSGLSEEDRSSWTLVETLRSEATKAIEPVRKSGVVGHSLDTSLTLYLDNDLAAKLSVAGPDLAEAMKEILIVSRVEIAGLDQADAAAAACEEIKGARIGVARADGEKCPRCWKYEREFTPVDNGEQVCLRCAKALGK